MQVDTALGAKLKRAGFLPREVRFQIAVAEFINNGGSIERAHQLIAVAADKLESEGRQCTADKATWSVPPLRTNDAKGSVFAAEKAVAPVPEASPHAAKGQYIVADTAKMMVPNAAPERNGAGFPGIAAKAVHPAPASVSSTRVAVKQHSRAKRGASAIASVQRTMAKTLFDTYQLPGDDRGIGDVTWKELSGLARKHAEAYRLTALIGGYADADPDARVRDVLKEETLKEFIDIARLSNVH